MSGSRLSWERNKTKTSGHLTNKQLTTEEWAALTEAGTKHYGQRRDQCSLHFLGADTSHSWTGLWRKNRSVPNKWQEERHPDRESHQRESRRGWGGGLQRGFGRSTRSPGAGSKGGNWEERTLERQPGVWRGWVSMPCLGVCLLTWETGTMNPSG